MLNTTLTIGATARNPNYWGSHVYPNYRGSRMQPLLSGQPGAAWSGQEVCSGFALAACAAHLQLKIHLYIKKNLRIEPST